MVARVRRWVTWLLVYFGKWALRAAGFISEPAQSWSLTQLYPDGSKRRFTIAQVSGITWETKSDALMLVFSDVYGNLLAAFQAASVVELQRYRPLVGNAQIGEVDA